MKHTYAKDTLREVVRQHPGITTPEAAEKAGLKQVTVASAMHEMRKRGQVRYETYKTLTNRNSFRHYLPDSTAPIPPMKGNESGMKGNESGMKGNESASFTSFDSLAEHIAGAILDSFMPMVAAKLQAKLPGRIEQMVQQAIPALPAPNPPIIEAPREAKRKVCVAGLLPQQAGIISSEFGEVFDLHFWKNGNPKQIKDLARSCEVVYTMTDFVGHDTERLVGSVGGNLVRVHGGMTALRNHLTHRYVNE